MLWFCVMRYSFVCVRCDAHALLDAMIFSHATRVALCADLSRACECCAFAQHSITPPYPWCNTSPGLNRDYIRMGAHLCTIMARMMRTRPVCDRGHCKSSVGSKI